MGYKFENLEVWQLSLEFVDKIYGVADSLPEKEKHNLRSQMIRGVTSISLNVAEGSMSQTDAEFNRFLGIAIRSCAEVVTCLHLAKRREYINGRSSADGVAKKTELSGGRSSVDGGRN